MVWAVSLSTMKLIPHCLTPTFDFRHSEFDKFRYSLTALDYSVLYLPKSFFVRLALKLFRGEPAISEFDWLFTPIHRSSDMF